MKEKKIGPSAEGKDTDCFFAEVYQELKRIAGNIMRGERDDHTLQPTAVVHEAYLKLSAQKDRNWPDRKRFIHVAALSIRRILVDYARRRNAAKRGGGRVRITLSGLEDLAAWDVELLQIDGALEALTCFNRRAANVVELRFFGGLAMNDIAELLGVSKRTVEGDWTLARAWLYRELFGDQPEK